MSPHALSSSAALSSRIQTGLQEAASRPSVRQLRSITASSARLPSPSTTSSPASRKWRAQAWGLPNLNLSQNQTTQQQASQASTPVAAAVSASSGARFFRRGSFDSVSLGNSLPPRPPFTHHKSWPMIIASDEGSM